MAQGVKRRVVMPDSKPEVPDGVESTGKAKPRVPKSEQEDVAQFISRYKTHRIGLSPRLTENVNGKIINVDGTGDHIQFDNWVAFVGGEHRIKALLAHKDFGVTFDIDHRDQTGYWVRNGYLTIETEVRETVKRVVKTEEVEAVGADN